MKTLLLSAAIGSLVLTLWAAWSFFQGQLTQEAARAHFAVLSMIWFATATWWNHRRG